MKKKGFLSGLTGILTLPVIIILAILLLVLFGGTFGLAFSLLSNIWFLGGLALVIISALYVKGKNQVTLFIIGLIVMFFPEIINFLKIIFF